MRHWSYVIKNVSHPPWHFLCSMSSNAKMSNLTLYHFWKQKLFLEQNFTFEAKVLWKVPILGGEVDHLPVYCLPPDRCLDES